MQSTPLNQSKRFACTFPSPHHPITSPVAITYPHRPLSLTYIHTYVPNPHASEPQTHMVVVVPYIPTRSNCLRYRVGRADGGAWARALLPGGGQSNTHPINRQGGLLSPSIGKRGPTGFSPRFLDSVGLVLVHPPFPSLSSSPCRCSACPPCVLPWPWLLFLF